MQSFGSYNVIFLTQTVLWVFLYLGGIVAAIVFWRRWRMASVMVIVSMGLMILATGLSMFMPLLLQALGSQMAHGMNLPLVAGNLVGSLIRAAATVLLLAAVFVGRPAQVTAQPPQQGSMPPA